MKKYLCSIIFLLIAGTIFSQQKNPNGIYTVCKHSKNDVSGPNLAVVQFSPGYVNEDPENYKPLVVQTDNYYSFESCGQILVLDEKKENGLLFLQLNEAAKEKLTAFTTDNLMNEIAVVINDEVVAVYKVTMPVVSGLIKISITSGQWRKQAAKDLKRSCKI